MYAIMLRQLNLLTLPGAISIASFDATFFVLANLYGLTGRDIALGVIAAGAGGLLLDAVVLTGVDGFAKLTSELPGGPFDRSSHRPRRWEDKDRSRIRADDL